MIISKLKEIAQSRQKLERFTAAVFLGSALLNGIVTANAQTDLIHAEAVVDRYEAKESPLAVPWQARADHHEATRNFNTIQIVTNVALGATVLSLSERNSGSRAPNQMLPVS